MAEPVAARINESRVDHCKLFAGCFMFSAVEPAVKIELLPDILFFPVVEEGVAKGGKHNSFATASEERGPRLSNDSEAKIVADNF